VAKEKSMALREELKQFSENSKKEMKQLYEKIKQRPLTCLVCIIVIGTAVTLLIALPYWRVTQFGIADPKDLAEMENSYRATLAQILGGVAVGIGIYFAWGNLTTAREGQITERFTRAVEQLGSEKLEIRLGGIYALERLANESDKDYWPIMEILTAYVRKNSPIENENTQVEDSNSRKKISPDIQAILTVIGRRKHTIIEEPSDIIDLRKTYLQEAYLPNANLKIVYFRQADLKGANLSGANLEGAYLGDAKLNGALLMRTHLEDSNLQGADLQGAIIQDTYFEKADLKDAKNLTIYQLNNAKTLKGIKLDEKLEKQLIDEFPQWFEELKS